jgi:hypothetical protein
VKYLRKGWQEGEDLLVRIKSADLHVKNSLMTYFVCQNQRKLLVLGYLGDGCHGDDLIKLHVVGRLACKKLSYDIDLEYAKIRGSS